MGMYSDNNRDEDFGIDMDTLVEAFLIDDLTHNYGEDTIKEFCAPGGVGDALVEAGVLPKNRRTLVRLSRGDDESRRTVIAAIQLARHKKDPKYARLVKYKLLFKQTRQQIVAKYGNVAAKIAKKGQKEYIKTMKGVNLSNSGSGAFLTKDPNR